MSGGRQIEVSGVGRDRGFKFDGFEKNPLCPLSVIPAKPVLDLIGEQESSRFKPKWIPAFAGMTRFLTFYDSIKF